MNLFSTLWHFVAFLGIIILILILIGIMFALIDTIYVNIKNSIIRNKAIKESQIEAKKMIKKAILEEIKNQIRLQRENEK